MNITEVLPDTFLTPNKATSKTQLKEYEIFTQYHSEVYPGPSQTIVALADALVDNSSGSIKKIGKTLARFTNRFTESIVNLSGGSHYDRMKLYKGIPLSQS